jgi:hypothetical protein
MTTAHLEYERVTREPVKRECHTLDDFLRGLLEAGARSHEVECQDEETGRWYRVRVELLGESTGVVNR